MRPKLHRPPCLALALALSASWASLAEAQDEAAAPEPDASTPVEAPAENSAETPPEPGTPKDPPPGEPPPQELSPEEKEKAWHEKTPESFAHRLFFGAGVGFGGGKGKESGSSSDRIGSQVFAQYLLSSPSEGGVRLLAEGQYAGITGVDTAKDESQSVQYFLAGVGVDWRFSAVPGPVANVSTLGVASSERMRFQGLGFVGFTKRDGLMQATGNRGESKSGAAVAVEGRYLYLLLNRFEAYTGLGLRAVGYTWVDFKLGVVAGF